MNATDPGEALRAWRQETHRSQTDLANDLGVFQEDVSRIEKGKQKVTRTLAKLIDKLSEGKLPFAIWFELDTDTERESA